MEHVTNRGDEDFKETLLEGLNEVKRSLKDLIFGKKLRSFKIMDPIQIMYV
jgi:hypothetical protein